MPTAYVNGLYAWTLEYADGSSRVVLGTSLASLINGSTPVVAATRGGAVMEGPPPVVTALVPNTAVLGSPDFTLSVQGTGFTDTDAIIFAGRHEPTTFVSPTELTTGVNMATWHGPDAVPVAVLSLSGQSNALDFTFTVAGARREEDTRREQEPPRHEARP